MNHLLLFLFLALFTSFVVDIVLGEQVSLDTTQSSYSQPGHRARETLRSVRLNAVTADVAALTVFARRMECFNGRICLYRRGMLSNWSYLCYT